MRRAENIEVDAVSGGQQGVEERKQLDPQREDGSLGVDPQDAKTTRHHDPDHVHQLQRLHVVEAREIESIVFDIWHAVLYQLMHCISVLAVHEHCPHLSPDIHEIVEVWHVRCLQHETLPWQELEHGRLGPLQVDQQEIPVDLWLCLVPCLHLGMKLRDKCSHRCVRYITVAVAVIDITPHHTT